MPTTSRPGDRRSLCSPSRRTTTRQESTVVAHSEHPHPLRIWKGPAAPKTGSANRDRRRQVMRLKGGGSRHATATIPAPEVRTATTVTGRHPRRGQRRRRRSLVMRTPAQPATARVRGEDIGVQRHVRADLVGQVRALQMLQHRELYRRPSLTKSSDIQPVVHVGSATAPRDPTGRTQEPW